MIKAFCLAGPSCCPFRPRKIDEPPEKNNERVNGVGREGGGKKKARISELSSAHVCEAANSGRMEAATENVATVSPRKKNPEARSLSTLKSDASPFEMFT